MKHFALLLLVLCYQLGYSQKVKNFDNKILYAKTSTEGCLDAHYGQYPEVNFEPTCQGREEEIHTAVMYGSYSTVSVTAGVEYSFITYSKNTVGKTTFITISNEAGTQIYASGYDTVKWTPTKDEIIRYYIHSDNQCGMGDSLDTVKKHIRCGAVPPEPTYSCDQNYDGPYWAACSISGEANYLAADDFFIPKDSEAFKLKSLKYLLIPLAADDDFKNFTVAIHKDSNNSPGEIIKTYENLTASEVTQHTDDFMGFPTFWATLTLPDGGLEIPVNKDEDARYWISLQVWSKTEQNIFLTGFHRINGWLTAPTHQNIDNNWMTTTYEEDPGLESIWSFDADCTKLGVNDINREKIYFYPNPIKDILNISSKNQVKEVSIFNYVGQKIVTLNEPKSNKIDVSKLTSGSYLVNVKLENGTTETFKVLKK